MYVKKGTLLLVTHNRKGKFKGIAEKDFDTDKEEFYPIKLAKGEYVEGLCSGNDWIEGESIPCRNTQCTLKAIEGRGK